MTPRHFDHERAEQLLKEATDVTVPAVAAIAATCAAVLAIMAYSMSTARAGELITVNSAAGPITVSHNFAPKIVPLIAELKSAGFDGRVSCYAAHRGGHVPNSLHFSGNACDFLPKHGARRGRNRMPTVAIMFSAGVARLISKYGLRNGCSFRDCGHIDNGRALAHRRHRAPWPRAIAAVQQRD